jgi:hypothetical protein
VDDATDDLASIVSRIALLALALLVYFVPPGLPRRPACRRECPHGQRGDIKSR